MKLFLFLFFILTSVEASEKEEEKRYAQISQEHWAGVYLIYDCMYNSYLCIDKKSLMTCESNRDFLKIGKKCHFLKKLKNYKECKKEQVKLVNTASHPNICN